MSYILLLSAQKLEIWASRENSSTSSDFTYLGYITLSDNASTMYKSRELKSVALPETEAVSLKFRLHKPHCNAHNIHEQVRSSKFSSNKLFKSLRTIFSIYLLHILFRIKNLITLKIVFYIGIIRSINIKALMSL